MAASQEPGPSRTAEESGEWTLHGVDSPWSESVQCEWMISVAVFLYDCCMMSIE